MKKPHPHQEDDNSDAGSADLTQRLARYRDRVEAEGRRRSLLAIDRAIKDAQEDSDKDV